MQVNFDAIVVGSGPGGGITANYLAKSGLSVLVLEAGMNAEHDITKEYTSEEMLQKYKYGGLTTTIGTANINYVEGSCVGGGSEINSGLYHRTPKSVLDYWRDHLNFSSSKDEMSKLFSEIEKYLSISLMPSDHMPEASLKLKIGSSHLGVDCVEVPRWYQENNGIIEKTTISKSYLRDAIDCGAILKSNSKAVKIFKDKSNWVVESLSTSSFLSAKEHNHKLNMKTSIFKAKYLFICGGVMSSCELLRKSKINKKSGSQVYLHPTAKIVSMFENELFQSSVGVPVHQVKQWSPKVSLGSSIGKKPHLGLSLLSNLEAFENLSDSYDKMAIYYASISGGVGKIQRFPHNQFLLNYKLSNEDYHYLRFGLLRLSQILFAAGAKKNFLVSNDGFSYKTYEQLELFLNNRSLRNLDLMTIHLMGGNSFNIDGICNEFGEVKGYKNLYIQDASLLPTSLGVNPQGTIMALVARNMEKFTNEAI